MKGWSVIQRTGEVIRRPGAFDVLLVVDSLRANLY